MFLYTDDHCFPSTCTLIVISLLSVFCSIVSETLMEWVHNLLGGVEYVLRLLSLHYPAGHPVLPFLS